MAQLRSATQWLTLPVDELFGDGDGLQDGLDTFVHLLFLPPAAAGFLSCGSSTSQEGKICVCQPVASAIQSRRKLRSIRNLMK